MTDTDNPVESYAYDEPTPADEVVAMGENGPQGPGRYIIRMGEPPIKVGGGTKEEQFGS